MSVHIEIRVVLFTDYSSRIISSPQTYPLPVIVGKGKTCTEICPRPLIGGLHRDIPMAIDRKPAQRYA
jgi:hypothetical protein